MYTVWTLPHLSLDKKIPIEINEWKNEKKERVKEKMKEIRMKEMKKWSEKNDTILP